MCGFGLGGLIFGGLFCFGWFSVGLCVGFCFGLFFVGLLGFFSKAITEYSTTGTQTLQV